MTCFKRYTPLSISVVPLTNVFESSCGSLLCGFLTQMMEHRVAAFHVLAMGKNCHER